MVRCAHEVEYREVGLPFEKTSSTPYDLLELDHRIHRSKEYDIADISSIDSSREFLGSREYGWDGFLIVLEIPEIHLSHESVKCRHTDTIEWIFVFLHLVDEVSYQCRMCLIRTEYYRLLTLVYLSHHQLDTLPLSCIDLDTARMIEFLFFIDFSCLYLSLDDFIISDELVGIERCLDTLHFERREESIVDPVLQ